MAPGDVFEVEAATDVYYVDTGMYDTAEYGSVYIIDADRPAIVDTGIGTNYERTLDAIESIGIDLLDVEVIAPTHVHLDHAGGAGYLAEAAPNATVYVHELGAPHLESPDRLVKGTKAAVGEQWTYYVEPKPVPGDRIEALTDGDVIDLGDRTLEALHAPGHAPHQVIFHDERDAAVYTADAAGIYVQSVDEIHVTSPPSDFDLPQVLDDVETIEDLDPDVLLYGHYGPHAEDPLGALDEYRTVISDWVDDIEAALDRLGDDDAVVEYFIEETELDEIWGAEKASAETAMNVRGVLHYLKHRDA